MLYPIKFRPRVKERIWGGHAIAAMKAGSGARLSPDKLYGESWELSSVSGDVSVVANGFLKGNDLNEIVEVYMGDLVGEKIFERYGIGFPLLVKYLDCNDVLSVQVHPDDTLAAERHDSAGKTEMWYVVDCKPGAALYVGFKNPEITREEYIEAVAKSTLPELLNRIEVSPGDIFFIPAGVVHALGAGIEVIEIQQTSDITYRIYDWDRVDASGRPRELHTALAVDAIDFSADARELHKHSAAAARRRRRGHIVRLFQRLGGRGRIRARTRPHGHRLVYRIRMYRRHGRDNIRRRQRAHRTRRSHSHSSRSRQRKDQRLLPTARSIRKIVLPATKARPRQDMSSALRGTFFSVSESSPPPDGRSFAEGRPRAAGRRVLFLQCT